MNPYDPPDTPEIEQTPVEPIPWWDSRALRLCQRALFTYIFVLVFDPFMIQMLWIRVVAYLLLFVIGWFLSGRFTLRRRPLP